MKLEQISDHVYANLSGETGGNIGIIELEDQVLAVDAQYPVSGRDFRASISSVTSKPVTHLCLTHYHGDHIFGAQAFVDCEIVAHRWLKAKMEENLQSVWAPEHRDQFLDEVRTNRPENLWLFDGLKIVLPTQVFDDRIQWDGVEMIHMGGHSADSSIVYIRDDRVLFAGDLIFAQTFPWAGDPSADPDQWIHAFTRLLEMEIDTVIPGHGPRCDKAEIMLQRDWFEAVRDRMQTLIAQGVAIEDAVQDSGFPPFYAAERPERRTDSLRHWYRCWAP
jgi:glyoxylase-like metal-dependent hydrolase (beta-lactamase superfamily II)